jgi:hypothetical protein
MESISPGTSAGCIRFEMASGKGMTVPSVVKMNPCRIAVLALMNSSR